ncbi:uncharacterized protein [Centruroides vittatus]|uniref:uncharacterized protein n=1 Tax=Centruroides vittatus TaxID=120091 RepID=UPI00350FFE74
MCTVCSLSLKDTTKNTSEKTVNEKYSNESILEVEVSLITSRINVHHSESSTSSKTLSKTQFNENEITDISKNDETESGKNDVCRETHTNNIDDVSKSKDISEDSPDFYKNLIINDVLYCLLQISDGRNFGKKKWLHVVFRLFFSKSGFFRDILYDPEQPQFCFTQIFPVLLNDDLLQSTNNNIMVIEIWERSDQKSEQKKLRGLCKLPLHCFYLVFNNSTLAKSHLLSKFPVISTSGYTPVVHPITNLCNGELNILFALGTLVQIENAIEKYSQIESENKNEIMTEFKNTVNKEKIGLNGKLHKSNSKEVKHFIEFSIESLGDLEINKDLIWGEAECYMTYCFPSQYKDNVEICLFKSDIQLLIPNLAFQHKMKHTYILKENENICNILLKEFTSQKNEDSTLMKQLPVKLWGSFYNPYQRIELLASTYLLLNDVCSFIQTDTTDSEKPIYKTYKLPFQTNFTNSTRLKVDHIKINLKYWKGDANMESRFTENDHINSNKTNNTSIHSALEADHSVQLDLIEILEDPSLEKSLEVNGKNDVVTKLPKNNECIMEKPEKDASVSNKTYSKNLIAKHNYSDINSRISDMPFFSKNNDFVFYTHIFIERALHLPMVMNKERISISPSPYVTFNINNEESFYTNVVNSNCSPVWDWHQNVSFKMISKNQEMNLVFKIWHAADERANSPNSTADRVLGVASVDFSLLFHGLNQISGWYNVMDINGKCQGQIKISIIAQNKKMFQECTNCVIQERDWNNSQIITLDSKQLSETTQEINNFVHKSLKEHMNELDLLYSQLMKRLADVSSPIKVFGGLAASKFGKEGTGREISKVSNDEIFSSLSLQCINLADNNDKVKAGNQTLCDIHQYSSVEGSIIEHDNTPEVIIPSTNCPSTTESCVFVREQKFIPTLSHSKCISASLLHSSVEQEDGQCHYCNEFRLTKKVISDKDARGPVDANLSTQLKGNAVSENQQLGEAEIETVSSSDDANKQS